MSRFFVGSILCFATVRPVISACAIREMQFEFVEVVAQRKVVAVNNCDSIDCCAPTLETISAQPGGTNTTQGNRHWLPSCTHSSKRTPFCRGAERKIGLKMSETNPKPVDPDAAAELDVTFIPSLYLQRHVWILRTLRRERVSSVSLKTPLVWQAVENLTHTLARSSTSDAARDNSSNRYAIPHRVSHPRHPHSTQSTRSRKGNSIYTCTRYTRSTSPPRISKSRSR